MLSTAKFSCAAAALLALLPSCATIVKQGTQSVAVNSQPSGLDFVVKDPEGNVVGSGKTPKTVKLNTGAGYFKAATYTIQTKRGGKILGEQTITGTTSGWYFGNILIGGLVGLVIVDPLTGAMYSLPKDVTVSGRVIAEAGGRSLSIASIDTLNPGERAKLVRL